MIPNKFKPSGPKTETRNIGTHMPDVTIAAAGNNVL